MSAIDWTVLAATLGAIVGYGLWQERGTKSAAAFLGSARELKWWTVGLSVMATQASAITFLSMPGQAYEDGMGFVQFYFGQPIAMIVLCLVIVPIYYRLKVVTAYEYLEQRFDRKTRQLTALLFLLSRGLAAGISIYAPAIVLEAVLGWPARMTSVGVGAAVILYTVSGGSRIVSRTQTYQMIVMLAGMAVAAMVVWTQLPRDLSFGAAIDLAGALGKTQIVDTSLRFDTRYTLLSGLTGGLFVGLAYFGTDQSQVQRYLGGASLRESRLGLIMNGIVKVPMQLLILFCGVLVFLFYQFTAPPVSFARDRWATTDAAARTAIDAKWQAAFAEKRAHIDAYLQDGSADARRDLQASAKQMGAIREEAKVLIGSATKDSDYIFIDFVVRRFPPGLVGLLLAVILCASMSAVGSALSALGTTSVVDFYKPSFRPNASEDQALKAAKIFTVAWGCIAIAFATFAVALDNLIQAVNILGSLFYGPMLGVFLVGFFLPRARANAAFFGLIAAEIAVISVFIFSNIGFLWYNVIGCAVVVIVALLGGANSKTQSTQMPS